ncbi:tail fiber domain-containing protein [Vallitalea sp.]|jgi:hypothetical protein|uniref:tail fiber domain-containing protein n=1 Tax=Vallitalea sp. TaxID=1882829 RepID=UPI0026013021|nr:tail fiber domain-containing protein [Vallitalea sp.]MCT4688511.1 tail fiber domain-containing protein [Vallitalea sp.]
MKNKYKQMKKLILFLFTVTLCANLFSQLKIEKSMAVLDGTIQFRGGSHTLRIIPNNPGTEIGASSGRIDFWYTNTGYNTLYAKRFYTQSDRRTKKNITPLNNCLDKVLKLNTYSYNFKNDTPDKRGSSNNKEFGLIAQELEKIIPNLVSSSKDIKLINYDGLIPFLIEAVKEQQKQIDILQKAVASQERDIIKTRESKNDNYSNDRIVNDNSTPMLFNNMPNPVKEKTTIKCYLPKSFIQAEIMICDLQGKQVKLYNSFQAGENTIEVNAAELYEGMFIYTLIVDSKIIDSKRMVITK